MAPQEHAANTDLAEHYIRRARIRWVQLNDVDSLRDQETLSGYSLAAVTTSVGVAASGWLAVWSLQQAAPVPILVLAWSATALCVVLGAAFWHLRGRAAKARATLERWDDFVPIPATFTSPEQGPLPSTTGASTTDDIFPGEPR